MRKALGILLVLLSVWGNAETNNSVKPADLKSANAPEKFQAVLGRATPDEILGILTRVEQLSKRNEYSTRVPIAIVLHNDQITAFKRQNYQKNKRLVDLAAKLDAFEQVDLKVCEVWMRNNNVKRSDLPTFLESVRFGPDEVRRLKGDGYVDF